MLDLDTLLAWDSDSFDEHFDLIEELADELGSNDAVLAKANELFADDNADVRALAFDLLSVAITPDDHELVSELLRLAAHPAARGDDDLRWSVVHALADVDNERLLEPLLDYADVPDSDIRFWIARGASAGHGDLTDRAVTVMLSFMTDDEPFVRDWATFALGVQSEVDSAEIRAALVRRLDDADQHVRDGAAVGLATRRDPQAWPLVAAALERDDVPFLFIHAAESLADREFLPRLLELQLAGWDEDSPLGWSSLRLAIEACRDGPDLR